MDNKSQIVTDFTSYKYGIYRRVDNKIEIGIRPTSLPGHINGSPNDAVAFYIYENLLPAGISVYPDTIKCTREFRLSNPEMLYYFTANVKGWYQAIPFGQDAESEPTEPFHHKYTANLQEDGSRNKYMDSVEVEATKSFERVVMKYIAGDFWTPDYVGKEIVKIEVSDWGDTKITCLQKDAKESVEVSIPSGREYELVKLFRAFCKLKKQFTGRDWATPTKLTNMQSHDSVEVSLGGKQYKVSASEAEKIKKMLEGVE